MTKAVARLALIAAGLGVLGLSVGILASKFVAPALGIAGAEQGKCVPNAEKVAKGSRVSRPTPPNFTSTIQRGREIRGNLEKLALDPEDPVMVLARQGRARELFLADRRDEKWAAAVERNVLGMAERDLSAVAPAATGLALECRSATCRMTWSAPPELQRSIGFVLRRLYEGAAVSQPSPGEIIFIYKGGYLGKAGIDTADELAGYLKTLRERVLKSVHAGRAPEIFYRIAPKERWPQT